MEVRHHGQLHGDRHDEERQDDSKATVAPQTIQAGGRNRASHQLCNASQADTLGLSLVWHFGVYLMP